MDMPDAPVREASGGVVEGFAEAEALLIEHASTSSSRRSIARADRR
jgi:hypothetical protein